MSPISVRKFKQSDKAVIQNWPPYPSEFLELDYALRNNGWLDEFQGQPDANIFVATQGQDIVAFIILVKKICPTEAEFRIAVRADKIGQGVGKVFTAMIMNEGFSILGLTLISLIVRKNNPRAISLYQNMGFTANGECIKSVNGQTITFIEMTITKPD